MSDKIKVTIVTDNNEKLNNGINRQSGEFNGQPVIVTHDSAMTLMSTLLKNGLISGSFCGGRGNCGRCKIQYIRGAAMPTPLERSVMEPEELRQGYRLACLSRPKSDCVIRLALVKEKKVSIVSEMIDLSANIDPISQQNKCAENRKACDIEPERVSQREANEVSQSEADRTCHKTSGHSGISQKQYVAAVDLGTTTIAMQLCDVSTGAALDTYCEMNPQRSYGADVLSRIQASCEGHKEALQKMVWDVLERGMAKFADTLKRQCKQENITCDIKTDDTKKINCMCIAGNTTMEHLLLGYDAGCLGVSPFTPVEIGLQEIRYPAWDFPVYIAPGISTFVGGDIVAGLYVLGMTEKESKSVQSHGEECCGQPGTCRLLIDLGTNGEMAITDGSRMIVTATAAGPAFEGGAGAQVIGTDMIAVTAAMLEQGVLDETGLLEDPYFENGITVLWKQEPIRIENRDIRNLQLAKAAVRAGVEILWEAMGKPPIDQVYLAGGFGYYLDVEAAFRIGLLPERLRGKVRAVGNSSLAGACKLACDLYGKVTKKKELEEKTSSAESINLAKQDGFERLYLSYMNLRPN